MYIYIHIYIYIQTYMHIMYMYIMYLYLLVNAYQNENMQMISKKQRSVLYLKKIGGKSKIIIGLSVSSIMFQKSMKRAYVIK